MQEKDSLFCLILAHASVTVQTAVTSKWKIGHKLLSPLPQYCKQQVFHTTLLLSPEGWRGASTTAVTRHSQDCSDSSCRSQHSHGKAAGNAHTMSQVPYGWEVEETSGQEQHSSIRVSKTRE